MRVRILAALLTVLVILGAGVARGQSLEVPLLMIVDGDVWAWNEGDPALRQITTRGFIYNMNISPDGSRLAYTSWSDVTRDAVERSGFIGGGELPVDVFVMDLASGQETRIASQPADAALLNPDAEDNAFVRSRPVWSPDGSRLAWGEFHYPDDGHNRFTVYDLSAGRGTTFDTAIPPQLAVPGPLPVLWGESGLLVRSVTQPPADPSGAPAEIYQANTLYILSPEGRQLLQTTIQESADRFLIDYVLARAADREMVALRFNNGDWSVLDPRTGETGPLTTPPQIYNRAAPDVPPVAAYLHDPAHFGDLLLQPLSLDGQYAGQPFDAGYSIENAVVSPDGRAIAFNRFNRRTNVFDQAVEIWRDGQVTTVPETDTTYYSLQFVWGAIGWRLQTGSPPVAVEPSPAVVDCPGALPGRLAVGGSALVIPGSGGNNLRSEPNRRGARVGMAPERAVVSVLEGPFCSDGIRWWRVSLNGQSGWTAEGADGVYYLEPAPSSGG